ncbi:RNase H family protein [Mycobacteriaceae bacterium NPDC060252]
MWDQNRWLDADLWQQLDAVAVGFDIDWRWVKGHAGHEGNELADQLATRGAVEFGGSTGAVGATMRGSGKTD